MDKLLVKDNAHEIYRCCYNCMYGHDGLNGVFEPPESIFIELILNFPFYICRQTP